MDSICPILSIGSSELRLCLGADCKWWTQCNDGCNNSDTPDIQTALREAKRFSPPLQQPEKMAHTPGPWESCNDGDVWVNDRLLFMGMGENEDRKKVDARMVRTAPDMLEALVLVNDYADIPQWLKVRVLEVIAKARGSSK